MVSIYLVAPFLGWIVAQGLKVIAHSHNRFLHRKDSWRLLYEAGGLPSTHSSTVTALLTVIGLKLGINSPLFGVAALLAAIVIYDAINVRYNVGRQGEILKELLEQDGSMKRQAKSFSIVRGHTFYEAMAGIGVGFVVGLLLYLIY